MVISSSDDTRWSCRDGHLRVARIPDAEEVSAKQDPPATIGQLQVQLDCFVAYDNEVRPHRALKRRTPREAFEARTKASPRWEGIEVGGYLVLHDKVGKVGKVTLRFESRLHHIGLG